MTGEGVHGALGRPPVAQVGLDVLDGYLWQMAVEDKGPSTVLKDLAGDGRAES
ncbi:hypothetical protein GCM10009780_20840 [Actinomadura alba]